MDYTADAIMKLIQQADSLSDDKRLDIFEFLSKSFSLIPVRGGFPHPGQSSHGFKAPTESNWQQWCKQKRPFNRTEFSPQRAGIACGPASGVLVLDVDAMEKFQDWLAANGIDAKLPSTLTVKTGGEGERYHFYFQYPQDGLVYGNRSVKGVFDIRGVGGQVLCPGSLHPDTRKPYKITENPEEIVPAPEWLRNFILHRTTKPTVAMPESNAIGHFKEETMTPTTPPSQAMPILPAQPAMDDPFIASLSVSENIKQMIVTLYPNGQRSEPSMAVLVGLLSANIDAATIRSIYELYPIGEKSRENKPEWLDREIEKAKHHIATESNIDKSSAGASNAPSNKARKYLYKTFNALDVINAKSNFEFLIEKFWPKHEPLLITGHGGAGKSLLTLQVAMDLVFPPANGFLDKFKIQPEQHKILFVQSENTFIGMKKRLSVIRSAYAIHDNVLRDNIFFLGVNEDIRSVGDMMRGEFQDTVKENVENYGADILVIDPLISFHSLDENSNDQMRRLLDQVSILCEEVNVTPLLIHHHGKFSTDSGAGGGRGASAIGDWSPNTWELSFNKNSKQYTLQHNKARNFMIQDKITLDINNLRFKSVGGAGAVNEIQYVVAALQNLGGSANSMKSLKEEVVNVYAISNPGDSISENTAKSYIKKAIDGGNIKESSAQKSNAKIYTF